MPCRGNASRRTAAAVVLFFLGSLGNLYSFQAHGFVAPGLKHRPFRLDTFRPSTTESNSGTEEETMDDKTLLRTVTLEQLVALCQQHNLSTKGTKVVLLKRLRDFAAGQADLERDRRLKRVQRVEEGSDSEKERFEIVDDDVDDEEEEEDMFYFALPDDSNTTTASKSAPKKRAATNSISSRTITAPPPPIEPNKQGERVVQVYSTTDQNDLTGIAAAQPGQSALGGDALTNPGGGTATNQPWDMEQATRNDASSRELEEAKGHLIELVTTLLAMSGAPAFVGLVEEESETSVEIPTDFVGFNPGAVPTDVLTTASKALRAGRGQVLQDVLRQFEMQAIGQDGMNGDEVDKGGGHYREVQKVRAFLEGYRRAEVRRLARETTGLLLDKLVQEGVEGLDLTLATMTRSSDDTSEFAGELNDSLLDYLNDALRQQEKKVDQMLAADKDAPSKVISPILHDELDAVDQLWNVTDEDGQRIESIDPNDPKVRRVLQEEYAQSELSSSVAPSVNDRSAPEQLLLLLTLLRERIKAEAAFAPDEKGRNLRLLAYCLRLSTESEREQLILKDVGNSLDRLDSFIELVASSIEYGESTSYQLQPAKTTQPLNIRLLKSILELAQDLRERQSFKASGVKAAN